jgi:hypothetical protein
MAMSNAPRLNVYRLHRLTTDGDSKTGRWIFAGTVAARSRREAVKSLKSDGTILPVSDASKFGRQPWRLNKV